MIRGPNHGQSKTRLYQIWCSMKNRCYNPFVEKFPNYGGRGIKVCPEWKDNFLAFWGWAYNSGYKEHLQIDRIDCNKDYSPENCRWVTPKQQQRNRTNSVYLTAFGETKLRKEWSEDERCMVSEYTLIRRLKRKWSVERALTQSVTESKFSNQRSIQ